MDFDIETLLTYDLGVADRNLGAVVPPVYQNTFFAFDSFDEAAAAFADSSRHTYSRITNPTVTEVENKIAALSGAEAAKLFASGMGAISAAVMHCVKAGDHVLAIDHINMPIKFLFNYLTEKMDLTVEYLTGNDPEDFRRRANEKTTLFYLESPTSEDYRVIDIRAITAITAEKGIHTILDNTWSTPLFQKPLEMGIELEVHSCSKYLSGHSDVISGVVLGNKEAISQIAKDEYCNFGAKVAPWEAWLLLRSLRTLPARMEGHQRNGLAVAEYLSQHQKVKCVLFPGLASDAGHELSLTQMTGYTGRFTVELNTDEPEDVKRFMDSLKLFHIGVSWGGFESQVYSPGISSFKGRTAEELKAAGINVGSLRFSIGLESAKDLIADLEQALERI